MPSRGGVTSLLNGWIIAWLVLWAASASIYGMRKSTGIGLYMYASEQYCQGTRMYYGRDEVPEDGSNFEPFAYPPLMVLPTVALVPFPDVLQRILWAGINAGLLVLGIFLLARVVTPILEGIAARREQALVWLQALFWGGTGLICLRLLMSPLENQSQDILVFICIAAGVHASSRGWEGRTGFWWALGAALKLTPMLFIVLLVAQMRFKAIIAFCITIVVVSILPDLINPVPEGEPRLSSFVHLVKDAVVPGKSGGGSVWAPWNELNQNLSGTIFRITHEAPEGRVPDSLVDTPLFTLSDGALKTTSLVLQGFLGLVVVGVGWLTRGVPRTVTPELGLRRLAEAGVVVCMMLLLSPMSSKSHYVVLMIPVMAVLLHLFTRKRDWIDAVALIAILLFAGLSAKGLIGRGLADTVLVIGGLVWATLFLGVVSGRVAIMEARAEPRGHSDSNSPDGGATPRTSQA